MSIGAGDKCNYSTLYRLTNALISTANTFLALMEENTNVMDNDNTEINNFFETNLVTKKGILTPLTAVNLDCDEFPRGYYLARFYVEAELFHLFHKRSKHANRNMIIESCRFETPEQALEALKSKSFQCIMTKEIIQMYEDHIEYIRKKEEQEQHPKE